MIIKDTPGSSSFMRTVDGETQIASGPVSVSVTNDAGVFINGPVSISSSIQNIKVGAGLFRFNSMLATGIPSTLATPLPVLELDLPLGNGLIMMKAAALASSIGV